MKRLKILASLLVVASVVAINTKQANATDCWKQDSNGWWLQEGSSYVKNSWKSVNGQWYYFDSTGYMKTGWVQDNGKWYYLNSDGKMLSNTTINGYTLGADGALIQLPQETPSDPNKVLSSGMTLRDAKHSIDTTIERFKSMGQSVEDNMGFINEQCKGMGTTYEEISRLPELATQPQQVYKPTERPQHVQGTQENTGNTGEEVETDGYFEIPDWYKNKKNNTDSDPHSHRVTGGTPGHDTEAGRRIAEQNQ